ncbi:MAG: hypothetical protein WCB79_10385 [Halobacteriota archaeon]
MLERTSVELLPLAVNVTAIRIVDGPVSGNVPNTLDGRNVGSLFVHSP